MKKLVILLLIIGSLASAAEVKVGVFLHFPNVYQDAVTKELKGAAIVYLKSVMKDMGYTPVFVVLPISRIFASLQTGEIDMAGEFMKTPEREVFAWYPDYPATILQPSLFFLTENKLTKIATINDLKGMTIGYIPNSPIPPFLNDPSIVKFDLIGSENWLAQNYQKLLAGRVDAVMDQNPYSFFAEAKKSGNQDKIKVLLLPVEGTNAYMLFSKKSALGKDLVAAYNKVAAAKRYDYAKNMQDEIK